MKRKIFVIAGLLICLSIGTLGTAAYFTSKDVAHNVITTGDIDIELKEMHIPEEGKNPVPFEDKTGVMPGMEISKIVTVVNTSDNEAYVRVRVQKNIELKNGVQGDVDLSLLTMDFDTVNWTEKDGFYYYNEPLAPGGETEALFTTVSFSRSMGNLYQESTATIDVNAQATQVKNNGSTVLDAKGWPEQKEEYRR